MPAPTIESHNHNTSSGGTTTTIAVNAAGSGRVIVVCASIGSGATGLPTQTISSTDPNIGAWGSIGILPAGGTNLYAIQAWRALTTGVVTSATVTVTSQAIDDAATAYITVAGANTTQPLDQNSTLATGASNGSSAVDYSGLSRQMAATISTTTANTLAFTFMGNNASHTIASPVAGSTLTESALNAGGIRYAFLSVFTAPFTSIQTGTVVGSSVVDSPPLFAFAITADGAAGGAAQARALVLA